MRPDKAVVRKAIEDAGGNLSRAAGLLGCSRATLYTWVYALGLERHAGINLDDGRRRETMAKAKPIERPVAATVRLPEALWREAKIAAIRQDVTVSDFVRRALEATLGGNTR